MEDSNQNATFSVQSIAPHTNNQSSLANFNYQYTPSVRAAVSVAGFTLGSALGTYTGNPLAAMLLGPLTQQLALVGYDVTETAAGYKCLQLINNYLRNPNQDKICAEGLTASLHSLVSTKNIEDRSIILDLPNISIDDRATRLLTQILKQNKLASLGLNDCAISEKNMDKIFNVLSTPEMLGLKSLKLTNMTNLTVNNMQTLNKLLKQRNYTDQVIEELKISNANLDSKKLFELLNGLETITGLISLDLSKNSLDDAAAKDLGLFLQGKSIRTPNSAIDPEQGKVVTNFFIDFATYGIIASTMLSGGSATLGALALKSACQYATGYGVKTLYTNAYHGYYGHTSPPPQDIQDKGVNRCLKVLNLDNNLITDSGLGDLINGLKASAVRSLSLKANKITITGASNILSDENLKSKLEDIDLSSNKLGNAIIPVIEENIESSRLQTLVLADNNITNALPIMRAIRNSDSLLALDLRSNAINDFGKKDEHNKSFADYLRKNKTIQYLNLGFNQIKASHAKKIAKQAAKLSNLHYLDLGDLTDIPKEANNQNKLYDFFTNTKLFNPNLLHLKVNRKDIQEFGMKNDEINKLKANDPIAYYDAIFERFALVKYIKPLNQREIELFNKSPLGRLLDSDQLDLNWTYKDHDISEYISLQINELQAAIAQSPNTISSNIVNKVLKLATATAKFNPNLRLHVLENLENCMARLNTYSEQANLQNKAQFPSFERHLATLQNAINDNPFKTGVYQLDHFTASIHEAISANRSEALLTNNTSVNRAPVITY